MKIYLAKLLGAGFFDSLAIPSILPYLYLLNREE